MRVSKKYDLSNNLILYVNLTNGLLLNLLLSVVLVNKYGIMKDRKIKDYVVLSESRIENLEGYVMSYIDDWFEPIWWMSLETRVSGNFTDGSIETDTYYHQTLALYEEDTDEE